MAVIHISEEEAARDLHVILTKAHAGHDVRIEGPLGSFAIVRTGVRQNEMPRLASEILADLQRDGSKALLPDGFADAVEEGISSHENESIGQVWDQF